MRYIELNPVRASRVSHPGEYPWSSYACNASGQHNPLISAHPLYNALGNAMRNNVSMLIGNYFACLGILGKSMQFVKP
jgi:hypothetical protein